MCDNQRMFKTLKSLLTKSQGSVYGLFNSVSSYTSSMWSKGTSISLYEKSLYANKAIQKRAEKVGQIKFVIKDLKGNVINNKIADEWLDLLDRPNKAMTGDQFWRTVQKYYDIVGYACIRKVYDNSTVFRSGKRPDRLEVLRSDLIEIVTDNDHKEILKFRYSGLGGVQEDIETSEIIYLYNPNPRYPLLGESLLSSAARSIDTEVQISEYHSKVLSNGGKLETVFKVKNATNKEQIDKLKEQYRDTYAGARKAGEPLFLGGEIDIQDMALSPQELSYLDTKMSTLDDIAIATSVPKSILGVTSGETFSNADASIRIFLRETIKPLMDNLKTVLDWQLIPDNLVLDYIDPTPEDQQNKMLALKTADEVHAMTINEKREALGLDPIDGGDEILVPMNLVPLDYGSRETSQKELVKKKSFEHPLKNKDVREAYSKLSDRRLTKYQERTLSAVRKYFKGQEERLMISLGMSTKAFSDFFNTQVEIEIAKDTILPVLRQLFIEAGQSTMDTFDLGAFNFTSTMETSLQKRAQMFSESIIATTSDQLARQFQESLDEGESRDALVTRISNLYNDISKGRAEVIARTETHNAVQDSNMFAYKQAGIPIKIWVTVGDAKVREEHKVLDGEEKPIDLPFSNGLMYPSEPNCRCTI